MSFTDSDIQIPTPGRCPACDAPSRRDGVRGEYACHSWVFSGGSFRQSPECELRANGAFRAALRKALGDEAGSLDDAGMIERVQRLAARVADSSPAAV